MTPNNNRLNRSGTVVKRTVEYRSPLLGEDMPRKSLDIRFPDYPISAGKGQLRLLLPSGEDRSGQRPEIKLRRGCLSGGVPFSKGIPKNGLPLWIHESPSKCRG